MPKLGPSVLKANVLYPLKNINLVVTKVFLVLLVCFCASRLEIFQVIASSVSFVTDASQNEAQCFLEVETFNKPSSCFLKGAGHGTETGRTVMTSQDGDTTNTTPTAASNGTASGDCRKIVLTS